jgi:hypothetical protein
MSIVLDAALERQHRAGAPGRGEWELDVIRFRLTGSG